MWPFTKPSKRGPRIFITKEWTGLREVDWEVRHVQRFGEHFVVNEYTYDNDKFFVLLPGGQIEGCERRRWKRIDNVPGLTDAEAPMQGEIGAEPSSASQL